MSNKSKEFWEPVKDLSTFDNCWIKIKHYTFDSEQETRIEDFNNCEYIYITKCIGFLNRGFYIYAIEGPSIHIKHRIVTFERPEFFVSPMNPDIDPIEFVTEEEAISHLSEKMQKLIKSYLHEEKN